MEQNKYLSNVSMNVFSVDTTSHVFFKIPYSVGNFDIKIVAIKETLKFITMLMFFNANSTSNINYIETTILGQ